MKKLFYGIGLMLVILFQGCDLIDIHPYDARIDGYSDLNATAISRIESACAGKTEVRFVWMGDTQRWYDETEELVAQVNQRSDIDFVMHGGDISDFGMTKEFEWIHRIMKKLTVPYVALIGNHDVIGNGISVYQSMYGAENFSFVAGQTKFVCLNTNALEFDYSHPVPDFSFIKDQVLQEDERVRNTVVAMHTQPYGEQFDNNVADVFQMYLHKLKNLNFCMHAHTHKVRIEDIFSDGIIYYGCASMKERSYFVFTINPEGYSYEVVPF